MQRFKATILTLFPEMFPGTLGHSIAGRALKNNIWQLETINIRQFGLGKHKQVDSAPCGGGNGLIMRPDVISDALDFALSSSNNNHKRKPIIYYPSPRGTRFNQKLAKEITTAPEAIFLCGRYEGVDERVLMSIMQRQ